MPISSTSPQCQSLWRASLTSIDQSSLRTKKISSTEMQEWRACCFLKLTQTAPRSPSMKMGSWRQVEIWTSATQVAHPLSWNEAWEQAGASFCLEISWVSRTTKLCKISALKAKDCSLSLARICQLNCSFPRVRRLQNIRLGGMYLDRSEARGEFIKEAKMYQDKAQLLLRVTISTLNLLTLAK